MTDKVEDGNFCPGVAGMARVPRLAGCAATALMLASFVVVAPALASAVSGSTPGPVGGSGAAVLAGFLQNLARWFEYLAGLVSVATVAYGGLRYAAAHSPHAQAEAWRIVVAGLGGLVIALLAPTLVAVVAGLIPS